MDSGGSLERYHKEVTVTLRKGFLSLREAEVRRIEGGILILTHYLPPITISSEDLVGIKEI